MYALIVGTEVFGPSEVNGKPSEEMKKKAARTGGKIVDAKINKPSINRRVQAYGSYTPVIKDGWVDFNCSVVEIPTVTVRKRLTKEIQAEAGQRINRIWDPEEEGKADFRQRNAIRADLAAGTTDERFTHTDAIRAASDEFEAAIKTMNRATLAKVDVSGWEGWPNEG